MNQTDKPFIVPVFTPHAGCPHRCIFCNQNQTSGQYNTLPSEDEVRAEINRFLSYRKDPERKTEISYYGGNFLGLPTGQIKAYLEIADDYIREGLAKGIRFSTRPDTICPDRLDLIQNYPVSTIELGVQSMNNKVLTLSQRGHTSQATLNAMALLKQAQWNIGLQMMVGLPGDSPSKAMETGRQLAALQPNFVRIYPCLVLEGSPLARWSAQGRYSPMSLDEAVDQVKALYTLFAKAKIPVIRMGLQPTDHLNATSGILAGPFHPAFGDLVHSALWLEALNQCIGSLELKDASLEIRMHPHLTSRVMGHHRSNIKKIQLQFQISNIRTVADASLPETSVMINGRPITILSL